MRGNGFTLIEILVTLGITIMLATFLLPAMGSARLNAERAAGTSNMRQIGTAIFLCANDRDGLLPGPLQLGQKAYSTTNAMQLATILPPYLGIEQPGTNTPVKVFLSPAFLRAMKNRDLAKVHPFLMNISPVVDGVTNTPFGNDAPGKAAGPMKLAAVPPNVWILCDADQKNPKANGHPWKSQTPPDIIHGKQRLSLCIDGSVKNIDTATISDPSLVP